MKINYPTNVQQSAQTLMEIEAAYEVINYPIVYVLVKADKTVTVFS